MNNDEPELSIFKNRFRGFLPVIIDVETGGFNAKTDALLEVAAVTLSIDSHGQMQPKETHHFHVTPEPNTNIEQASLDFTGIDPYNPFRLAICEKEALGSIFKAIRTEVKQHQCSRAILVGHNAFFDHSFIFAAAKRQNIKRNPFHQFSNFDTVSLAGLAYGETVLAKACRVAGIEFDNSEAHSAKYDAERTADLFCIIANKWQPLNIAAAPSNI